MSHRALGPQFDPKAVGWSYNPMVAGERIVHTPGRRPSRPVDVGDHLLYESGLSHQVQAVSRSGRQILVNGKPMHREPIEGNFANTIWSSEHEHEATRDLWDVGTPAERDFLRSNPTGPSRYS